MKRLMILILFSTLIFAASDGSFRFAVVGDRTGGCVAGSGKYLADADSRRARRPAFSGSHPLSGQRTIRLRECHPGQTGFIGQSECK